MTSVLLNNRAVRKSPALWALSALSVIGALAFVFGAVGRHPQGAWQAYLINFLLWSSIAQGAVLFSALMHMTHARWSGILPGLAESFAAFFPLSFLMFLILLLGKQHVFPWLHEDLHGKEVWLNIPFLFARDGLGLLILYGLGFGYLFNALKLKIDPQGAPSRIRHLVLGSRHNRPLSTSRIQRRMTFWGGFYILAFALVLCLIGFDLVMSMDPHWISTLFGAYHFVKAFFVGLGALIILAAIVHMGQGDNPSLRPAQFHDLGKLFFGFCLLWADFFYVQLLVIYYGNIPEETHYIIVRTMQAPWNKLAWSVFVVCFLAPFFILLNKNIKTRPISMAVISAVVITGIWFEHLLLLGPALSHDRAGIPLRISDGLISLAFLSLMVLAVGFFLKLFPEITRNEGQGA